MDGDSFYRKECTLLIRYDQKDRKLKAVKRLRHMLFWGFVMALSFAGLTGCKGREAQFLIEKTQDAQSEKIQSEKLQSEKTQKEETQENEQPVSENNAENNDNSNIEETLSPKAEKTRIYVDVCGAVANPGVFQLEEGSRVFQAIEAAGGYLPEAAQSCINRASILTDGQQLYILTQEEMQQQGIDPAQAVVREQNDAGEQASADVQQDHRVNINTADESQLTTLNGIGSTRAQAIIAYREVNGPFAAIEEIMNVQGIKEGTFTKIKDEIVVE